MSLVKLFDKYGCDKGNIKHRYDRVYAPVLDKFENNSFNMLEIGVFKGNSTEAFIEYCPQAKIVGVDIFTRVNPENIPILNHSRVAWAKCDSLEGPNEAFDVVVPEEKFDIIIDDGLHTHIAQRKTFENFFQYLKRGGSYFIEDVWPYHLMSEKEKQHFWLQKHAPDFSDEEYNKLIATIEAEEAEIIYHDLRDGYDPDTFIIEIKKL